MEDEKNLALHFLTLSEKYLSLVKNILQESIGSKNKWNVPGVTDYHDATKWSDFNIIMPVLFNFYHGLELLMKGLLISEGKDINATHSLGDLLKEIKRTTTIDKEITNIIENHIDETRINSQLSIFLKENNLSVDKLHMAFRYPSDNNFDLIYNFFSLKYHEDELLPYFEKIISDIKNLCGLSVKSYTDKHENTESL